MLSDLTMYSSPSIEIRSYRLTLSTGQRKKAPRPARGQTPRRSPPSNRRSRRPARRKHKVFQRSVCTLIVTSLGRQNNSHQIPHKALHQTDPLLSHRPPNSRDLQTPPPHLLRMPRRLSRRHDRRLENSRHSPPYDRRQLRIRDGDDGVLEHASLERNAG